MITALPDISVLDITPDNNNFLVLACDGIWNSLSSQEVVDFILERINKPDVKLSSICEEVCRCLYNMCWVCLGFCFTRYKQSLSLNV